VIQTIFSGSSVKIDSSIQLESYEEKVKNVWMSDGSMFLENLSIKWEINTSKTILDNIYKFITSWKTFISNWIDFPMKHNNGKRWISWKKNDW
jgi:hypothetical protein